MSYSVEYEAREGGFYLSEVAGGYQLRSRPGLPGIYQAFAAAIAP